MFEKRKIKQYKFVDNELELIDTYNSIKSASTQTGIERHCIQNSLSKRRITGGGFVWQYADGKRDPIIDVPNNIPVPVARIHPKANCIAGVYGSINLASKDTGIPVNNLRRSLNGERKTAGGWRWKYVSDLTEDEVNYVIKYFNFNKK
jgi:hypothetical protein